MPNGLPRKPSTKKRPPIFQSVGGYEDGWRKPPITTPQTAPSLLTKNLSPNRHIIKQNKNLAVPTASSNTAKVNRSVPSFSKSNVKTKAIQSKQPAHDPDILTSVDPADLPQDLQFAVDKKTNVLFLIDTGCEVSMLPKTLTKNISQHFKPFSRIIQGIGDSELHPIGNANIEMNLGSLEPIKHNFWVTDESRNYGILGIDIIKANKLIIAPHKSKLYSETSEGTAKIYTAAELPAPVVVKINKGEIRDHNCYDSLKEECLALFTKYPQLTETPDYTRPPKHDHCLEIILDDYKPRMMKPRRCNEVCKQKINENFQDLTKRGAVVRGSADVCASPITVVPKKDGKLRICVDYTNLNKNTRPLSYPLPRIDRLPEKIPGGTRFFTTLDLKEAYYSLPIHPNSQKSAAVITPSGTYIPRRTTFGLRNAPTRFQQFMDHTFERCSDFTFIYIDDILIYSKSSGEHIAHLNQVLDILSNNGLYLNVDKCSFARPNVNFLGHNIGTDGINVIENKIEAIKNLPLPRTRTELKRFLGMVNYYRPHIPKIAEVMAPLNEISGGSKTSNRTKLKLNDTQINAYHKTIATLAEATTLAYEDHNKPLVLFTDASETHVGAVLEQESINGDIGPLAFFSKKLPPAKRVRSAFYKELRAVYLALKHFQARVLGRELIIRTDSKAVERAISNELGNQTPHEQRWICAIKEFNPMVIHIEGQDNVVADSLSRPPQMTTMYAKVHRDNSQYARESESETSDSDSDCYTEVDEEPVINPETFNLETDCVNTNEVNHKSLNRNAIAAFQSLEPDLIEHARSLEKNLQFTTPENMAFIEENKIRRVILPEPLRLPAYNAAHNRLHLGIEKSIEAIARTFWWPKLREDVTHWVSHCPTCQQTKVPRHNRPNIGFFPNNTQRFQFLHLDLLGPLESSVHYKYVLLIKDRATGFLVTAPLPDKTAITVRNSFVQNWVGHYGVPQVILSDNGREFKNELLEKACDQLGIEQRFTSPRTPQTNGYVERQNRTINVAFRSLEDKANWPLHLPLITSNINNSFIEGSPYTPAQYAFGCSLNLSGRVLFDRVETSTEVNRPSPFETAVFINSMADVSRKFNKNKDIATYYQPGLFDCKYVWLKKANRKKLDKLYQGPYEVVRNRSTEQSLYILKGHDVVKVLIRNVKAYVGPLNLHDAIKDDNISYSLRPKTPVNYVKLNSGDL